MIRTMLRIRARSGSEPAVATAWRAAAGNIARSAGNLRRQLLADATDPRAYVVVTEWVDESALRGYEAGPVAARFTKAVRALCEPVGPDAYRMLRELAEPSDPIDVGDLAEIDASTIGSGPGGAEIFVDVEIRVPAHRLVEFQRGYPEVTVRMARVPGYLWEELLRDPGSDVYHIFARWRSETEFYRWIADPAHKRKEAGPIAPFLLQFRRRLFHSVSPPATRTEITVSQPGQEAGTQHNGTDVLVVGAGPTGLTLAIELARRGIDCQVIDKLAAPSGQADKAIGVHCRTMEIWERQGVVQEAMNAGSWLTGQAVFVNGTETHRISWELPELPYEHLGLPQYETERLLTDRLAAFGVRPRRGVELLSFTDSGGAGGTGAGGTAASDVTATLALPGGAGQETIRAKYLVGCDGAHSRVRELLGLTFTGGLGRFPQLFMLGDVDVDWDMPDGHLLRLMHTDAAGQMDNMLVCVPLRGESRYRIATLAPARFFAATGGRDAPPGFSEELAEPTLADVQAALEQLAPPGTRASNLRWSSVFRISHGIVDRYRDGRVFVAGDAAHLHPPAGGQGMNTGIQDAWNLGWKLALAARGRDAPGLLDSYQVERRPAGAEIVGRAVRMAFTDELDHADLKRQFLQEMSMLLTYRGSPLVGESLAGPDSLGAGPAPGDRAPDVAGLHRRGVGHPLRLHELIGGTRHTLLVYADASAGEAEVAAVEKLATDVREQSAGEVDSYLLLSPDVAAPPMPSPPVLRDTVGEFRTAYDVCGTALYLIRPDGHVGFRSRPVDAEALRANLHQVFGGTN
ncbi:FAD-dependent monooxygenase [Solwaraspora sp. WMMB335]|uniref:FAD-dependent monooxygenase n=1 Tax=Solwaraspora sp. WMMB335 TaxID=3404118 RepID=UPI003B943743